MGHLPTIEQQKPAGPRGSAVWDSGTAVAGFDGVGAGAEGEIVLCSSSATGWRCSSAPLNSRGKGPPDFQEQGPPRARERGPSRATEAHKKRPTLSAPMRSVAQEDAGELQGADDSKYAHEWGFLARRSIDDEHRRLAHAPSKLVDRKPPQRRVADVELVVAAQKHVDPFRKSHTSCSPCTRAWPARPGTHSAPDGSLPVCRS
jgi:hypothetical protein